MTTRTRSSLRLTASLLIALAPAPLALAQDARAPTPGDIEPPSPVPAYLAGILLAGGALALTAMPSRRTHED